MKIQYYLVLSLLILFTSCQSNQEVKRFTFAITNTPEALEKLKGFDVPSWTVEVYQKETLVFLIIDALKGDDYFTISDALKAKGLQVDLDKGPLERIYKLDQKNDYPAMEGQLIHPIPETKRYVLTLGIVNDEALKKEYKRVHGKGMAWPEITQNMKQVGVKDMEIYLDGYQAYLIMDAKKDFDFATDGEQWGKLPRESEWQAYVAKFQKVEPESKAIEKWQEMKFEK